MSKFMNGLNNDIPSPVEEGVVDWFKKKIGKSEDNQKVSSENKKPAVSSMVAIDVKLLNDVLKQVDILVKKVINKSEYSKLKRGFYKVNPSDWWIGKDRYVEADPGGGIEFFTEDGPVVKQKYWLGVYGIRYDKIFKNKEYLDMSPEAERGDVSPEGKEFWDMIDKFEKDIRSINFSKIHGVAGIDVDSIKDWDDDPEVQIAIIIDPSKLVAKESYTFPSDKEAVQEELFPILTGKELPVTEGTWFDVAAIFGMLGIYAAGTYVKNRFFTKHAKGEKPSVTAEDFKKWLEEHPVDEAERRKVMKEVFPLFKKHFPKDCENGVINNMSGEWYDDKKFITGESNIWDFCFILSTIQGLPYPNTDDIDVESYEYSKLEKKYHSDLRKCKQAVNDELKKKYNGRYEIRLEELDEIDDGDGDEGCCVLIDVKRTKQLAEFYKSKEATKESFTEVATEGISNGALAAGIIGGFWGATAIGYGIYKILNPEPTYYDKPSQISPIAKAKMDKIKELEEASKKFMKTQDVDSSERRKVVTEAISLVKKYYPKDLDKRYDFTQEFGEYGSDAEDFYKGNCNLLSIGHTPSKWQEFPGSYELDLDTPAYEKAQKNWSATIAKCEAAINKDLSKKYKGKYKVFFEEVEKGGWWEYCWTGDGDEGLVMVVDVDMINKLKDYIKNKSSVKESTEVIYEGWGIAFTRFAVKHNLPFANKLEDKIWEWSESTVNQLTNIPEFKEYILREAPKAYDEAYLRNNNLSINVNADMISEFEEEYEDSEAYHKVDKKNCCFCKKIGKFYVGVFGDKSHIHGVWLLMSDSKNKKIYAKALPAPEKELNKFKYQK